MTSLSTRNAREKATNEQLARSDHIVEGAAEAIVSIDEDQNIIAFNKAAEMIFGYDREEILGKSLTLLMPSDIANRHAKFVRQFGSSQHSTRWMKERGEVRGLRKNGETFPAEASVSKQDTAAGRVYTTVLKDISTRKLAENALRESEERLRALTYYTPNKLHIKDMEGRYILINHKCEQLFGVSNDEAIGKTAADIFPSQIGGVFDEHDQSVIKTGQAIETEEEFCLADGVHTYLTVKFPIMGVDGNIVAVGANGFDITERRQAREELLKHRDHLEELVRDRTKELEEKALQLEIALAQQKEYSALQEKFVSMVGHEFRTPLTIIDGGAQRLIHRKDKLTPDEVVTRANKLRSAVTRMIGLIDTTLHASRLDEGKIELLYLPCDIKKLILEVCERQSEISPTHHIKTEINDLPNEIIADPRRLDQVFTNLLSNAIKYAPHAPNIEVKGWQESDDIVITVTDHGVGIPEDDLPHMFGRFFRARTAQGITGTGIGLSVVKEFVEMHGGTIDVVSTEGESSTFTVRMPIGRGTETQT